MSYKVVYCAVIQDEKHKDLIKIGDTDLIPTRPLSSYKANDKELQKAAESRIKGWSGTAAAGAKLIFCDILLRYNKITQNIETFRDFEVQRLVQSVGGIRIDFDSTLDSGKEWFKTDLETVVAAVNATKEGRDYLDTSEIPAKEIYDLREEQQLAVNKTHTRFEKAGDMLWHAKMRFGKTIAALNLVKKEGYKRTIIITHRPVVEDGWGSDFYHVFSKNDHYSFLTKIYDNTQSFSDESTDESIDKANEERIKRLIDQNVSLVYFASIQDLRGSKIVGGKFEKNRIVFETTWDCVIIDEAHEGTKTELGQAVINTLVKDDTKKLDLSGTAYNLLDKYSDTNSVFTWDYVMEQDRKAHWSEKHPGEPNPYADMPVMHINTFNLENAMREKGFTVSDKTFSFREFFRTWTGDLSKDGSEIPTGFKVGDFVHADHVRSFLNLLSKDSTKSKFPFATQEGCNQNIHTLWMVPGVKEAAALSKMLKEHAFFQNFGIANVAGEGDHDEEKNYSNALEHVRRKIEKYPCTITLSCGRLTTGVTVKEWTSVFMLSGSEETDAKQYMQTIFRVQSAGKINGVQKTDCFVYDFAPDRALTVVAEVAGSRNSKRDGTVIRDTTQHTAFKDFLEYCSVVAIDGAEFKPFSVQDLVSQINRVHIDRALRTGFMDNCIYDSSKFKSLTEEDIDKLNNVFNKLKETKKKSPLKKAGMAKTGLGKTGTGETGGKTVTDPLDKKKEEAEQKKLEKQILEKLRTISIRIPLLFFGGDFEITEGRLSDIVTGIDDASWKVFMPNHLSKDDFRSLVRYYNQETVIGAGKAIRNKAKAADLLAPTERTIAIAEIFSHFQNPSHETVLTPWRVVNMHMAMTLGGYCFFNEKFEENSDDYYLRLQDPRPVNISDVSEKTLNNADANILEINSKSGLYPLYVTYALYRAKLNKLGKKESECLPDRLKKIWKEAVSQVYVLCQSSMAVAITKKTLCGYETGFPNLVSEDDLVDILQTNPDTIVKKIKKAAYWKKGAVGEMKFDAVVGNPPYQDSETVNNRQGAIYNYFYDISKELSERYSLISPARFLFDAGLTPKEWNQKMLNDPHFKVVRFEADATRIFPNTEIKGGVVITYRDENFEYGSIGEFIPNPILEKISKHFTRDEVNNMTSIMYGGRSDLKFNDLFLHDYPQSMNDRLQAIQAEHPKVTQLGPNEEYELKSPTFEVLPYAFLDQEPKDANGYYKILGLVDGARVYRWIPKKYMVARYPMNNNLDGYKVFISKASGNGQFGEKLSRSVIMGPNSSATPSFISIGNFATEEEAINADKYINTKFARALLGIRKVTQDIVPAKWAYIPIQNFRKDSDIDWGSSLAEIDRQLYIKYSLPEDEIEYIEKEVIPM